MEKIFSLLLCFSFQPVFPSPLSLTSLSLSFLCCWVSHSPILLPSLHSASHLLITSPMLRSSPHFPPFIVPFYLHWPHFLLIFCSPSPLLVTPHPFVICLNDPYLLPPPCHSSFLITVIIPLIPPSSGDPQLFPPLFAFPHSMLYCTCLAIIHPSINLSFYLFIYIWIFICLQ